MTIATTSAPVDLPAGIRATTGTIAFDSSYPTAGEAVTPDQWGAASVGCPGRQPDFVMLSQLSPTTTNVIPVWIKSTGKVTAYGTAASAIGVTEVASTQTLSTTVVQYVALWITPGGTVTAG